MPTVLAPGVEKHVQWPELTGFFAYLWEFFVRPAGQWMSQASLTCDCHHRCLGNGCLLRRLILLTAFHVALFSTASSLDAAEMDGALRDQAFSLNITAPASGPRRADRGDPDPNDLFTCRSCGNLCDHGPVPLGRKNADAISSTISGLAGSQNIGPRICGRWSMQSFCQYRLHRFLMRIVGKKPGRLKEEISMARAITPETQDHQHRPRLVSVS